MVYVELAKKEAKAGGPCQPIPVERPLQEDGTKVRGRNDRILEYMIPMVWVDLDKYAAMKAENGLYAVVCTEGSSSNSDMTERKEESLRCRLNVITSSTDQKHGDHKILRLILPAARPHPHYTRLECRDRTHEVREKVYVLPRNQQE